MDVIDPIAVARTLLIYLHVLAIAVAAAAVAFGDFAIFARPRIDMAMLQRASTFASVALGVLWVTGLTVILMDIGFDVDLLAGKPKLMAKLTVVVVLTINSIGLHWLAFPRFVAPQVDPLRAATMPVVFGAISAASWVYAAFVGVAKPLAGFLGYSGFMGLFAAVLLSAIGLAVSTVRPHLARRMIQVPIDSGVAAAY